jgi:hypothetical protein
MQSALYPGQVMHTRQRPVRHRFTYAVTSLLIDLDEMPALARRLRLLGVDRRGVLSFRQADHGPRDGSPLRPWIDAALAEAGIDLAGGPVRLLCFPRIWGYVFNPLTVWFCHHRDGTLRAILYEVSNTFGQHHCYLIPLAAGDVTDGTVRQSCAKGFYVSPFLPMEARYSFRLREPGERLSLAIRHEADAGDAMVAVQTGRRQALTDANILRLLTRQPGLTFKVMAGIHWEAFHLWRKGAGFRRKPPAPARLVSTILSRRETVE